MHRTGDHRVVAIDYDGTIAEDGRVSAATEAALRALRAAGFRLILVTGRRLERIRRVCAVLDLFDLVILENGAVSYCPSTQSEQLIAPAVDGRFVADVALELADVPLFVGRSMLAIAAEHADRLAMLIGRGGYALDIVTCGERVLILPAGINKSSGLLHALTSLGMRPDQVVAVGDAANDLDLFKVARLKVAVGNAAPELKAAADLVLPGASGQSVQYLVGLLLAGSV